ncbi:MAG TPA: response regulator [Candidatus Binatia bacterium]|nr:response regulator [Candidatus Binatia bacterium]
MDKPLALVADDAPSVRSLMKTVLEMQGYSVLAVEDGKKAYDALKDGYRAQMVLTDLDMPEMNGLELVKNAVTLDPNIACIVLSGGWSAATPEQLKSAGAKETLNKPFDIGTLKSLIDKYTRA